MDPILLIFYFYFFLQNQNLFYWTIRVEIAYLNHLVCFPSSSSIFQQCNWSTFSIRGRGWWLELDPVVKRGNIDYLLLSRGFYGFASGLYSSKQIYFPVFTVDARYFLFFSFFLSFIFAFKLLYLLDCM